MVGIVGKQEDLIKIFQSCRPAQVQHSLLKIVCIGFWLIFQYWVKENLVYVCQMNHYTFFVGYLLKKIIIIFLNNCFMILVLFVSSLDNFNLTIFLAKWEFFLKFSWSENVSFPVRTFPLKILLPRKFLVNHTKRTW